MSDAQIAFGIKRMNELQIVDGGDAKTMGIGIMTEQRWKADLRIDGEQRAHCRRTPTGRRPLRPSSSKTSKSCGDRIGAVANPS